jgi:L-alanine-DL-glutamate epimerase-like enolase superfamily enzyme
VTRQSDAVTIEKLSVAAYKIPTDAPESDGTYEWDSTTIVTVDVMAGGKTGLGYTYADASTAKLIDDRLKQIVIGRDAISIQSCWDAMVHSIRNLGRPGICSMAISAVDVALWDLKARLLDLPLVRVFGQVRDKLPIYGSGGFTSYEIDKLQQQLRGWVEQGIAMVKMKIGRDARADIERVHAAREAIGKGVYLFVDANAAYTREQALKQAKKFSEFSVTWFEEPVSSDDLEGLRLLRDCAPPGMNIAAGEYGYDLVYFRRMLDAGAVDVLQADATRCAGFTGFLQAAKLCEARHVPLSSHCAPALHLHIGCAAAPMVHAEYFHDHARIEKIFLEGNVEPDNGALKPDLSRLGMGLELKRTDVTKYCVA